MVRETAGALASRALKNDHEHPQDLGNEWSKDIIDEVWKCIDAHKNVIVDKEFFVVMVYADDSLIKNCIRRKFYAWPWMPKPRQRQTVWLYRRDSDTLQGLWCLPNAIIMARMATENDVAKKYNRTKNWCLSYFRGTFPKDIRKEYNINFLTESEYNSRFSPDPLQSSDYDPLTLGANAFDFEKALTPQLNQVTNSA